MKGRKVFRISVQKLTVEMNIWKSGCILLILAVGFSTAETLKKVAENVDTQSGNGGSLRDSGKSDYETALRPAVLQKRSIANIARLLLGGNVPNNHPLVKYPEPKTWNLANNMVSSLPGASLAAAASSYSGGWAPNPNTNNAMASLQQFFETKAKLMPYTGQVVQGISGLASVKGDLLRQIHTISTQAIAQAAAEAAARALASAAAAHAVTNSLSHASNHGAQVGIKGGWSSYQNVYTNSPYDKTPGDMPGPPYPSSSAHINHYSPPPSSFNNNPYPVTTPSPPVAFNTQPQPQFQNGYYTLYNTQPATSSSAQTPYTPAPPVAHARPTLSPNTLIATTPSGYSPSLSKPIIPQLNNSLINKTDYDIVRSFEVHPPGTVVTPSSSNNTPLPSFRRTVPAGFFGRHAAAPSSTSSLLSTISSLLSASTNAYNNPYAGPGPAAAGHYPPVPQSPAVLSNLLSAAASAPVPATPPIHTPPSSVNSPPSPSVLNSGISSAANIYTNNGYQQQSVNPVPQGGSNYGSPNSGNSANYVHHQPNPAGSYYAESEARPSVVNPPSYTFNQHVSGHNGANYAQSGANSYIAHAIQSSPQFTGGFGNVPAASSTGAAVVTGGPGTGYGAASYSTAGAGFNRQVPGPGYSGNPSGNGPSNGHVGGWNTQHAGPSPSASTWPSPNFHSSGYSGQASGNAHNPSGSYGRPAQFPVAAGSAPIQQTYPTIPPNAYQSPAPNAFTQAQQPVPTQPYAQPNHYGNNNNGYHPHQQQQHQYQAPPSHTNSVGGLRNSNLNYNNNNNYNYNNNYQRHDTHDQSQSASTLGNDYDDVDYDDEYHYSYQQAQRRNRPSNDERPSKNSYSSSRYPSSSKKRPVTKRPSSSNNYKSYSSSSSSSSKKHHSGRGESIRNSDGENDKRVTSSTGSKKGSNFDSSVDVVDMNYERETGDHFYESEENRNTDKNRWRSKNSSGQRTNPFHNHNSNGRWSGKNSHSRQTSPKDVRGNVQGSERTRPESGQSAGKNYRGKKITSEDRQNEKQRQALHLAAGKSKQTISAHGGRNRQQQQWKQQPAEYKSRDVYTTLPEYVFRVGERPDVFLRPGGKRKHGNNVRGRLSPRFGETVGSSSGSSARPESSTNTVATQEDMATAFSSYIQSVSKEHTDYANETVAKSTSSKGTLFSPASNRRKEEKFVLSDSTTDETARADFLSDLNTDTGLITASEEFDPEEREAFVDDVYADGGDVNNKRRHDYQEDEKEIVPKDDEEEEDDDVTDK